MSFTTETQAALVRLAQGLNFLNTKDGTNKAEAEAARAALAKDIAALSTALNGVQATANAATTIDNSNAGASTTFSGSEIEARIAALDSAVATRTTEEIAAALEGEDLSDITAAISDLAAKDMDLATAASVAAIVADLVTTNEKVEANRLALASHAEDISNLQSDVDQRGDAIGQLQSDLGDVSSYDPVQAINNALNFDF